MTKIQKISKNITPYAGCFFVNEAFNQCGLSKLIDEELGRRTLTGYQYSEIFRTYALIFFCGGHCAEDIHTYLRPTLESIPDNQVPSPDTLLRAMQELATSNTTVVSKSGNTYQFNINEKLNDLNIKLLLLTKQLKEGAYYDFDYDNQIIAHKKWDAKKTYKKTTGYCPGVASIGNKIVYVENRDGNAHVKLSQDKTLSRAYQLLRDRGIGINRSWMDAGSYGEDIIKVVAANSRLFYIRANHCEEIAAQLHQIPFWQEVEINDKKCQLASMPFTQFLEEAHYRLVVIRRKMDNQPQDLFTGTPYTYFSIVTNDHHSSEKEIVEYYNQRGASEKLFDIQNNDFGWGHLPCSDMHANTVYLIMTALCKNFYNYFVQKIAKVFTDIPPVSRMKRFIFCFIAVSGRWVYRGRQWILQLYTCRPYERVFG
jgi:hypothetical protein